MMETDIMVGAGMKLTCSATSSLPSSGSSPGRSRRAAPCRSSPASCCAREGGELQLAATDMELSLRTSLEAQVEDEGSVVVPGRLLVDLARLLPNADVQIEHRPEEGVRPGGRAGRRATGCTRTRRRTSRGCRRSTTAQIFSVESQALLDTVAQVSRSASRDESRPVLTGILARFEAGQARHGRDGLVPARRQGDGAQRHRPRSSRRSSRRARSPSSTRIAGDARSSSSACRRTRSRSAPTTPC